VLLTLIALLALSVLYWFPIRRWFHRWGASDDDLARVMAGDAEITEPTYSATLAVTVDTPPEHIWPWLVQMGFRRGGLTATTDAKRTRLVRGLMKVNK
jgi:hypothetical protein